LLANYNSIVHGHLNLISADSLELLLLVSNHHTKGFNVIRRNSDLRTGKCVTYVKILRFLIITEPQSPVELFDAVVAVFHNLVDGHI